MKWLPNKYLVLTITVLMFGQQLLGNICFEKICVDEVDAVRATFQSHNQKVLQNKEGIFFTYACIIEPSTWILMRWKEKEGLDCIYQSTGKFHTTPPCVEADESGNIFLCHPDWSDVSRPFYFYKFSADYDYKKPQIVRVEDVDCAAKFCMERNSAADRFFVVTQYGRMLVFDNCCKLMTNKQIISNRGPNGLTQYPNLFYDGKLLHLAITTVDFHDLYRSIQYMNSADMGSTWKSLEGREVLAGSSPDETGPTTLISRKDELDISTWLANFTARDGKLHFVYRRKGSFQMRYLRYDLATGKEEIHLYPHFKGDQIELNGLDGFFVNSPQALYCIMKDTRRRLAALRSEDNGRTWRDYALDHTPMDIYALGGYRELTQDGHIIGTFTEQRKGKNKVWLFRLPAD